VNGAAGIGYMDVHVKDRYVCPRSEHVRVHDCMRCTCL